jgi:hypothetical protein
MKTWILEQAFIGEPIPRAVEVAPTENWLDYQARNASLIDDGSEGVLIPVAGFFATRQDAEEAIDDPMGWEEQ